MTFSAQAIRDGKRIARLCKLYPKRQFTKVDFQNRLGLSPHRAQKGIDWCKQQRSVKENPFYAVCNGRWTYGYRSRLVDVVQHTTFNLGYIRTRLSNVIADMEHELLTAASLAKDISPTQRATMNTDLAMARGTLATLDRIDQDVFTLLVP